MPCALGITTCTNIGLAGNSLAFCFKVATNVQRCATLEVEFFFFVVARSGVVLLFCCCCCQKWSLDWLPRYHIVLRIWDQKSSFDLASPGYYSV